MYLVRHVCYDEAPPPPPPSPPKLRILYVAPRPTDLTDFSHRDWDALPAQPDIKVQSNREEVRELIKLAEWMNRKDQQITALHFDGHGATGRLCPACKSLTTLGDAEACGCCGRPFLHDDGTEDVVSAGSISALRSRSEPTHWWVSKNWSPRFRIRAFNWLF